MIVDCPRCNKPMSSVAPECENCGFARGELSEEQMQEMQRRRLRDRIYRLKMGSYAAISLLLIACGWYWWESGDFSSAPTTVPIVLVAVGALSYLVIRGQLFVSKRRLRKLR